ncbi:hypothetical protein D7D07_26200 [Salmonella enterica]|nr:hypothetical protein [Salmonella enterica]
MLFDIDAVLMKETKITNIAICLLLNNLFAMPYMAKKETTKNNRFNLNAQFIINEVLPSGFNPVNHILNNE